MQSPLPEHELLKPSGNVIPVIFCLILEFALESLVGSPSVNKMMWFFWQVALTGDLYVPLDMPVLEVDTLELG